MSISPVDGRYRAQTEQLSDYFSEFALIRYRVRVELEYFIALCEIPLPQLQGVSPSLFPPMRKIYQDFGLEEAYEIKATEKITNHDVKAVEYFIKERFRKMGLESYVEFIHFGLTSQDINNTATHFHSWKASEMFICPFSRICFPFFKMSRNGRRCRCLPAHTVNRHPLQDSAKR